MSQPVSPPIRFTRLILSALILGLLLLTGIVIFLRNTVPMQPNETAVKVLPLVVVALFASMGVAYFVLRMQILARLAPQKDEALELLREERMPIPLHTLAVFGAAMAEGPGLLAIVAFFLGAPWYVLAAPLLAIGAIAALMPSRERIESLVRDLAT